jgi:AraC-like DNA-binding protein
VHDGHPATAKGFRKRVAYLEGHVLGEHLIGAAVDGPCIEDAALRGQVSRLDRALITREELEAVSRLALVTDRLTWHLTGRGSRIKVPATVDVARRAREILEADVAGAVTIAGVAETVGVSAAHLVRSFTRSFGIPPHQYLLGRRLELARRRLLAGDTVAGAAAASGFYDQAHLTRHFKRLLGVTPGGYQRGSGIE